MIVISGMSSGGRRSIATMKNGTTTIDAAAPMNSHRSLLTKVTMCSTTPRNGIVGTLKP